jgi:hypothetical protein
MDPSIGEVIGGALSLDPRAYQALQDSSHPLRVSAATLLLVGVSWMIGHCSILFLNRVPPGRFVVTTLALACSFVLGIIVWVASTWPIGVLVFGMRGVPLLRVIPIAAFGYAPLVLSALIIIPYVGAGLETLLNTWALLALVLALSIGFELSLVEALVCALLGWGLTKLLPRLAGGRVTRVFDNAWYRVSVRQTRAQGEAAAAEAVARLRAP